jgi:hypothetical protein
VTDLQQLKIQRMVAVLDWCATANLDGRMPASVYSDIVIAYMLEATTAGVWSMVCASLMARGHAMFADMLKKEAGYAA